MTTYSLFCLPSFYTELLKLLPSYIVTYVYTVECQLGSQLSIATQLFYLYTQVGIESILSLLLWVPIVSFAYLVSIHSYTVLILPMVCTAYLMNLQSAMLTYNMQLYLHAYPVFYAQVIYQVSYSLLCPPSKLQQQQVNILYQNIQQA